jgi:hypothetical protein
MRRSKPSAITRSEEVAMQAGEPSHTARGAAAYRAIHQTLEGGVIFSDPFASKILDDETRARLDETAADPSLRPMRLFIAARSRFSEDTLAACVARGVRQVRPAVVTNSHSRSGGSEHVPDLPMASCQGKPGGVAFHRPRVTWGKGYLGNVA